jgi:hypothetical protein
MINIKIELNEMEAAFIARSLSEYKIKTQKTKKELEVNNIIGNKHHMAVCNHQLNEVSNLMDKIDYYFDTKNSYNRGLLLPQ